MQLLIYKLLKDSCLNYTNSRKVGIKNQLYVNGTEKNGKLFIFINKINYNVTNH